MARKRPDVTTAEWHLGREPGNKGRTFKPEPLTRAEVNALLRVISNRGPSGIRNRALVATLYGGGLRISEALALHPKDVDVAAGTIRVLHGKGDRDRLVSVDPRSMEVLDRWLAYRRGRRWPPRWPVFCTISDGTRGHAIHAAYARELLTRAGKRAGIGKRVHPHGLRHTHAYELAVEGVPVHVIRRQLGHSSLDTTDRYISHLAPRDVQAIMSARDLGDVYELAARRLGPAKAAKVRAQLDGLQPDIVQQLLKLAELFAPGHS